MIHTYGVKTGEIWQIDASLTAFGMDKGLFYRGPTNLSKDNTVETFSTADRSAGIILSEKAKTVDFFGDDIKVAGLMKIIKNIDGISLERAA